MSTSASTIRPATRARTLIERVRARWRGRLLLHEGAHALAIALGLAVALVIVDQLLSLAPVVRGVVRWLPPLVLLWLCVRLARRAWPGPDDRRIALLAEEARPELDHQLSTLLDLPPGSVLGSAFARRTEARLESVGGRPLIPLDPARALLGPAIAAAAALSLFALVPGGAAELSARWIRLAADPATGIAPPGAPGLGATADEASRSFRDVRIVIEPPDYTGSPALTLSASGEVTALAGSTVSISGIAPRGTTVGARLLGAGPVELSESEGRWRLSQQIGTAHRGLEIVASEGDAVVARLVVPLIVTRDRAPLVTLLEPDDDLVLASARATVPVRASATDDFGIADFRLSWILSRGSGESFSFTDGGTEWTDVRTVDGARVGTFDLDLAAMGLGPGDVLHVRATARDANGVTGPGEGVSRTRVIRIAREGEESEATTLLGFPIEPEKDPILSQRMIILLTERLLERAPDMTPEQIAHEANDIAWEQARLRERLADIIYARTSGGEEEGHGHETVPATRPGDRPPPPSDTMAFREWSRRMEETLEAASAATGQGTIEELSHDHDPDPALAVNLPLVPAFNAMYEAERELRQAAARSALPHEYRALEIIQRVREAERVYLRGRQTVAPVDVAGVRGTGKVDDASPAPRSAAERERQSALHVQAITSVLARLHALAPAEASLALSGLAARMLEDTAIPTEVGSLLAAAATAAREGRMDHAIEEASGARRLLSPGSGLASAPHALPASPAGARYSAARRTDGIAADRARGIEERFVFATARYASGDWDSGQLVPANLIHSLALYTDIAVAPEGVIVDLDSPDLFRYPFVFMTGHLPVRFTNAEAENIRDYVERGGFLFIDDHNHDIDGAFHRTVTAELDRIFGEGALERVPNDHELYATFFPFEDGPPTTSHELNGWGDGIVHEHLFAIRRPDGRIGVLYSNKDYTSEWSYHVQNKRFLSLDNTRFGVNLLIYALTR